MGRLFHYNRFGKVDTSKPRRDSDQKKPKEDLPSSSNQCPAYSELYPEYSDYHLTTTCSTAAPTVATLTTSTAKNVEMVFKKYQQWSSKFLHTITPANIPNSPLSSAASSTSTTNAISISTTPPSASTTSSTVASISSRTETTTTCTNCPSDFSNNTSGYYSHQTPSNMDGNNDTEELIAATEKKYRVYDCMRDFLRRKFFHQKNDTISSGEAEATSSSSVSSLPPSTDVAANSNKEKIKDFFDKNEATDEDDITSDYDEIDMLDSSYNADEEDATDCSCSYSSEVEDIQNNLKGPSSAVNSIMPQRSLLSLKCWKTETVNSLQESTTDEEICDEDSDAGISDCCQLIGEPRSPKKKSPKRLQFKKNLRPVRFNISEDDLSELMDASWYQPRISTKAASQHLQQSEPGTFLVRRKSNCFELCLKSVNKVKQFTVIAIEDNYKIKGARKQFTSLKALVTHHSVMAEQLPLTLALPREPRNRVSVRYADDFDTLESLHLLDLLKNLQTKHYDV